jgi:hypothetical protein
MDRKEMREMQLSGGERGCYCRGGGGPFLATVNSIGDCGSTNVLGR